jgi:hypothetical protein
MYQPAKMQNQFLKLASNIFVRENDIRWLTHYQPPQHEPCILVGTKYAMEARNTFYVCEKDFPKEYHTLHQWYQTKVYTLHESSPK